MCYLEKLLYLADILVRRCKLIKKSRQQHHRDKLTYRGRVIMKTLVLTVTGLQFYCPVVEERKWRMEWSRGSEAGEFFNPCKTCFG